MKAPPPDAAKTAARRILLTAATLLFTSATLFFFLAGPSLGGAYRMIVGPMGSDLPTLTAKAALPLLRIGAADPLNPSPAPPWVWGVWLVLLVLPPASLAWSLSARTAGEQMERWVLGTGLFAGLLLCLLFFLLVGLALPLVPLDGPSLF